MKWLRKLRNLFVDPLGINSMGAWFAWFQVLACLIGMGGFLYQRQWPMAWIWFGYSMANLGFVGMAGGFK